MISSLSKPIDNAALIVFRIFFGFLLACESFGAIATGWVKKILIDPQFTFSFIGFEWLQPLSGNGMYFYFFIMGILGILIMIGYRYTYAMILYTLLWTGVYFMQKSSYNNHYYLLLIISFIMIFLPANKSYSLDTKLNNVEKTNFMPQWIKLVFITQIAIVYFYAAFAKLYPDWLDGTFTKNLLSGTTNNTLIFDLFSRKWFYISIAYTGILYDLLIIPMLLTKKTRTLALISSLIFHLFNAIFLQIGIFPFFALSFALFFYPPEKIRSLFLRKNKTIVIDEAEKTFNSKIFLCFFTPFLIIQLLLPIRHYFIKGDVLWTEEGHRLSWRMMLRERSGYISFKIIDNSTNKSSYHDYHSDLSEKQSRQIATKPDFIWQYCQKIKNKHKDQDISIYITCKNAINRKEYKTLIDPDYDMAKAKWNYFTHNEWITTY
ncbi:MULTISPECIES: HTTM domain-containing protein [Flavobacterium]|uniref:HTTM domain-containing protein n=1 Tax=Flavobacterium jumunjinense TaxID=998845 RepID=A0ABV5GPJ7_9FLAO|nr:MULTISPECIES: HTTM domain-containing protein [Flavobacterium]